MSVAFVTHCSDDWFYPVGCNKLLTSAKVYHPDIPFFVFGTKELNKLNQKYDGKLNWDILNPIVSIEVANYFDFVVHFDADSFLCGPLEELLGSTCDIVGVRNNNDYNHASRDCDPPKTVGGCNPEDYMNAGLVGSRKKEFWVDWIQDNVNAYKYTLQEQDIYNLLLQKNKYSFECLDPKYKNVYYGISNLSGIITHWDSLKNSYLENDELFLGNKKIKVVHQAGGHKLPKLVFSELFSENISSVFEEKFNHKITDILRLKI